MSWTVAEIRSWYPERFADTENDNAAIREAFAILFMNLDVGDHLRQSAQAAQLKAETDLYAAKKLTMQSDSPDGSDLPPPLRPLPELRGMSLSELSVWMLDELDRCRRQLRAEEVARAGLERRVCDLERRENEREGGR